MTEQVDIELGDVVCVSMGVHTRIICVDYFDEKDNQQTLGGPVLESSEPEQYTPERGWAYKQQVEEVNK